MLIVLLAIMLGIVSGIREGMVMIQYRDPNFFKIDNDNIWAFGVRGHVWFH